MSIQEEVQAECERQLSKWGVQNHKNGTGLAIYRDYEKVYKRVCEKNKSLGIERWDSILLEEIFEALAEIDPVKLRAELIQAAAVIFTWIDCIDRRKDAAIQSV